MKTNDVKNKIIELTEAHIHNSGFKLRRTNLEYVQTNNDISHIFRINIIAKTGWFIISPEVYFGHTGINNIHQQRINKNRKISGITSGFGVRNEYPERGHYGLETEGDIQNIADRVIEDFDEIAIPFYDRITSISSIDDYYNMSGKIIGSQYTACDALIAAFLNNREFHDLAKTYYDFWFKAQRELANVILETERFLSELILSNQGMDLTR